MKNEITWNIDCQEYLKTPACIHWGYHSAGTEIQPQSC